MNKKQTEIEIDRFENKILKLPSGCWLWLGAIQGKYYKNVNGGYGAFRHHKIVTPAHRVSYEMYVGKIPEGLHIDHLCRITSCVNPNHLEAVTPQENYRRGEAYKGTFHKNKTHCPNGHEYSEENTVMLVARKGANRHRGCKVCRAEIYRKYNEKRRRI